MFKFKKRYFWHASTNRKGGNFSTGSGVIEVGFFENSTHVYNEAISVFKQSLLEDKVNYDSIGMISFNRID